MPRVSESPFAPFEWPTSWNSRTRCQSHLEQVQCISEATCTNLEDAHRPLTIKQPRNRAIEQHWSWVPEHTSGVFRSYFLAATCSHCPFLRLRGAGVRPNLES